MLPMYVSHIQILHHREKFSLITAALLDRYLFQQKTNQKEKYVAVFSENHQKKKKKVKNSI